MSVTRLEVFVSGKEVATLASEDGFEHHLTYRPEAKPEDFVSLVMPVRPETWSWPSLHPFFQVNLPEGFLLSTLKEQLGPHLGSRPLDLLAVVGRNSIGRVQVASAGGLEALVTVLSLCRGELHPVPATGEPIDAECPAALVIGEPLPIAAARVAVSVSLAFGGANAALVFSRWAVAPP